MFKIGVFSKLVRVSARMLRHYEKCGLLYPADIDPITGYRFYSIIQIPLLNKIIKLRDMGFSISEIGDILPNFENVKVFEKALQKKVDETRAAIASEQARLERLMEMRVQIQKGDDNMVYDVELKTLPDVKVISLKEVIDDYSNEESLWEKLYQFIAENDIPISADEGAYSVYLDDEYKENDVEIEISLPVKELGESFNGFVFKRLGVVPLAATIKFSGSYENYGYAMEKLGAWIEENGYKIIGNIRGVALHDLRSTTDPNEYLTELQIAVSKATNK
ncbi:MAG: MerR family transcriptional regulator [Clostridiales bacterium]|jgi:DNA-binding transcriptional MerR regulator|nr:MerR family transcriptional regulator [Clostridiales bacterium]